MSDYEDRKARAIAMPPRARPLTRPERNARRFDWMWFNAVVRSKDGNEDIVRVQAISREDADWRINHRLNKGDKVLSVGYNGDAY